MIGLCSGPLLAAPADELNTKGFRAYNQHDYPKALALFQQAVAADPGHALAHYNLACVMSLLRAQDQVCEYNAYVPDIMDHLEAAVRLDAKRKARLPVDHDLDAVRGYWRFQKLLGKRLSSEQDVTAMLVLIKWFGPAPGAMGPMAGATFKRDGTFELWQLDPEQGERRPRSGTFTVKGKKISFSVAAKGADQAAVWTGELNDKGELRIPDLDLVLTDDSNECSA